jgi:hypothetical protein
MATSQIHAVGIDYCPTAKQMAILKTIEEHTKQPVDQFLASSFYRALDSTIGNPVILGEFISNAWHGKASSREFRAQGPRLRVTVALSAHEAKLFSALKSLKANYDPTYWQYLIDDDVRAFLEAEQHDPSSLPQSIACQLHADWNKEIGL